jgi:hypothetical protein
MTWCRKYIDEDFEAIESWYLERGMQVNEEDFPIVGFIAPGIAAGFLMQTDTKCCILEPFIANPHTTMAEREAALVPIMEALVQEARNLGYHRVFGFSIHPTMLDRAEDMGFEVIEKCSKTVCKELI